MTTKKNSLLLGAHLSISDGFAQAVHDAQSIGCTAMQIFTKSNRQWQSKPITQEEAAAFKGAVKKSTIAAINVHASYLINIGSPKEETAQKSTTALIQELERCNQLGIPYLVLHPGAHLDTNENDCLFRIAKNLDIALEAVPGPCMILLENTAGQGSNVGYLFEHLATIRQQSTHKKRIGFCFDTCHAFAAGYDLRDKKSYQETWQIFDKLIGIEHVKIIHLNDSKKGINSHVDRHEDIGKGDLGLEAFRLIMNDERFADVAKILETPKETLDDDVRNLATLKSLVK